MPNINDSVTRPILMGRSFLGWTFFLTSIAFFLIAINSDIPILTISYSFLSGYCLNAWLIDGELTTFNSLWKRILGQNVRLMDALKEERGYKKDEKQKQGKQKE